MNNSEEIIRKIWEDKFLPFIDLGGDVEYFITPYNHYDISITGTEVKKFFLFIKCYGDSIEKVFISNIEWHNFVFKICFTICFKNF